MTYKATVYTGPTQVHQLADKFREAGIKVTSKGTYRVTCRIAGDNMDKAKDNFLLQLRAKHGTVFGIGHQDITCIVGTPD